MPTRRRLEHQEITRKHKDNSADVLDAWGLVNATDEMLEIARENGELNAIGEYDEDDYSIYKEPSYIHNGVRRSELRQIAKRNAEEVEQELKELANTIYSGKYVIKWYNGFCVAERTFNISRELYHKWLDKKKEEE